MRRRALAVAVTVAWLFGLSACGGPSAVCQDVEVLRADLAELKQIDIREGALAELSSRLDDIESDVKRLLRDASDQYATEISAVETAASSLRNRIADASEAPSVAALSDVSSAFTGLTRAVGDLRDAVAESC